MKEILINAFPVLVLCLVSIVALSVGIIFKGKSINGTCSSAQLVIAGEKESCVTCPLKTTEIDPS